jgi:hypothetical protein
MKLICPLTMAFLLIITCFKPVSIIAGAEDNSSYYDYSYYVELEKTQVLPGEVFIAHVHSEGTCKQDLPAEVSQAVISGKIVATLREQKVNVVLNPEFKIEFDGIPGEKGQTFRKDIDIYLAFPGDSRHGVYEIVALTTGAVFKVFGIWFDGLSYLSSEPLPVGSIECMSNVTAGSTSTPLNPQTTQMETGHHTELTPVEREPSDGFKFWMIWAIAAGIAISGLAVWLISCIHKKNIE